MDAAGRIQRAVAATFAEGNARAAAYTSFDGPVPAESDATGVRVIDFDNRRSQVTFRWVTARMLDDSQQRDTRPARQMKRVLSGSVELLFDGGRRYMRTDADGWTVASESERYERRGDDPLWLLAVLAGANDDVASVEATEVRGTLTHRHRLTVDFKRAQAESRGRLAEPDVERRRWYRRPSPTAPDVMPVELWLDDNQRIRRVSIAPLVAHRGDKQTLWSVLELWDFGRAHAVAQPD